MKPSAFVLSACAVTLLLGGVGCAARVRTIRGTKIVDTSVNREVLKTVEAYRTALERGDAQAMMLMASKAYREDSGSPTGSDDYGFEGLQKVLGERLARVRDIRYSLRYIGMTHSCRTVAEGCRVSVEALVDASYTVIDALEKERRPEKRDQAEFVLERTGDRWLFVSGM